mmetsp:Transcript_10159/g.24254  ORF Transcript_10159/g.24254 Transcript_10159/m.24254 type:complete len:315 (-) Transcript_10159:1058-2002(-)
MDSGLPGFRAVARKGRVTARPSPPSGPHGPDTSPVLPPEPSREGTASESSRQPAAAPGPAALPTVSCASASVASADREAERVSRQKNLTTTASAGSAPARSACCEPPPITKTTFSPPHSGIASSGSGGRRPSRRQNSESAARHTSQSQCSRMACSTSRRVSGGGPLSTRRLSQGPRRRWLRNPRRRLPGPRPAFPGPSSPALLQHSPWGGSAPSPRKLAESPVAMYLITRLRLKSETKFCVTATVISRLSTVCHHPPGRKTVSPGRCTHSRGRSSAGSPGYTSRNHRSAEGSSASIAPDSSKESLTPGGTRPGG